MSSGWAARVAVRLRAASRWALDRSSVWAGRGHVVAPVTLGDGPHDCALRSLYWAVPTLSEDRIREAFQYCAKNWPYGGVTNTEFAIALKYLDVEHRYFAETESLHALLARKPARCVALLPYHFIAILGGKVAGKDAYGAWNPATTVYCSWEFR